VVRIELVKKTTIPALAAGAALLLPLTGLAGAPAYAYPPGTGLTITASSVPVPIKPATFVVTVSNAKPGCKVRVYINDSRHTTVADPNGVGQVTFTVKAAAGSLKIRAKTFHCDFKEKASTFVQVDGWQVSGPGSATHGVPFSVSAAHFQPNKSITFLAMRNGDTVKVKGTTDANGAVSVQFTLPKGSWAIVATAGGRAATTKVKVL
jgi:hypothetical protein